MIQVQNLSMHYGPVRALDGVTFEVSDKEIVGLLGPNGAGKTTIMRILTTFVYPGAGKASVGGHDVTQEPGAVRRLLGYLPENPPLYTDMRVDDFLDFVGRARGLRGRQLAARKEWVAERCGVAPVWKHLVNELSLGYRQRVGLAQALIHDPRVLILDEPTSGLDPITARAFDQLIAFLNRDLGLTVLMATHDLDTLLTTARRIVVLAGGRVLAHGSAAEVMAVRDPWIESYFAARHTTGGAARPGDEPLGHPDGA